MMGKVDKYHWVDIGSSYVPSEVSCAILWAQLDACQEVTKVRRQFFEEYHLALSSGPVTEGTGLNLLDAGSIVRLLSLSLLHCR